MTNYCLKIYVFIKTQYLTIYVLIKTLTKMYISQNNSLFEIMCISWKLISENVYIYKSPFTSQCEIYGQVKHLKMYIHLYKKLLSENTHVYLQNSLCLKTHVFHRNIVIRKNQPLKLHLFDRIYFIVHILLVLNFFI